MVAIGRGIHNDHEADRHAPENVKGQESLLLLHVGLRICVAVIPEWFESNKFGRIRKFLQPPVFLFIFYRDIQCGHYLEKQLSIFVHTSKAERLRAISKYGHRNGSMIIGSKMAAYIAIGIISGQQ